MKTTPARVTTNIDPQLLVFVDRVAKERNVTRRDVVEESIKRLKRDMTRDAVIESYNRLADDRVYMDNALSIANDPANV